MLVTRLHYSNENIKKMIYVLNVWYVCLQKCGQCYLKKSNYNLQEQSNNLTTVSQTNKIKYTLIFRPSDF